MIAIQHDTATGRFHPARYLAAPMPGATNYGYVRYKSRMHHTAGFETVAEARISARDLAIRLGEDPEVEPVLVEVGGAGADVLILPTRVPASHP